MVNKECSFMDSGREMGMGMKIKMRMKIKMS